MRVTEMSPAPPQPLAVVCRGSQWRTAWRRSRSGRRRPRNDAGLYDDLVDEWWKPAGRFAALHWLARARALLVPDPSSSGALLLDLGCGGGIMAGHVHGYAHVGVDVNCSALAVATTRGVLAVRANAAALPVRDGTAEVVVAGELFEHVHDLEAVVAEIGRVLRPGGVVVLDTINDTAWARLALVVVGERMPGGPPPRIHDPTLFVPPDGLVTLFSRHGVEVRVSGLRPSAGDYLRFLVNRGHPVRMLPARSLSALYQGIGRKVGT